MTENSFENLLRWMHADREKAAMVYEGLRVKLERFFESYGCPFAEECTDETLERVAQKISAGVEVFADDPYIYARGVARNVLLEQWRKQEKVVVGVEELSSKNHPAVFPLAVQLREQERSTKEKMLDCLERCLQELSPESRQLFLDYHQDKRRTKTDHRASLAKELGIDITALRNRLTRLRKKMEDCVRRCAEQ